MPIYNWLLRKSSFARSIFAEFIVVDNSDDALLIAFSATWIPLFIISMSPVYSASLSCPFYLAADSLSSFSELFLPWCSSFFYLLNMQHIEYLQKEQISGVPCDWNMQYSSTVDNAIFNKSNGLSSIFLYVVSKIF